jgi:hypothetical protein
MTSQVAKRYVVCAACTNGHYLVAGVRHFDMVMHNQLARMDLYERQEFARHCEQGFLDNQGRFHSRESAMIVACEAGQLGRRPKTGPVGILFSEDLY